MNEECVADCHSAQRARRKKRKRRAWTAAVRRLVPGRSGETAVVGSLVDLLTHPSKDTDRDLGAMLRKIKGQWDWSTPTTDAAAAADAAL